MGLPCAATSSAAEAFSFVVLSAFLRWQLFISGCGVSIAGVLQSQGPLFPGLRSLHLPHCVSYERQKTDFFLFFFLSLPLICWLLFSTPDSFCSFLSLDRLCVLRLLCLFIRARVHLCVFPLRRVFVPKALWCVRPSCHMKRLQSPLLPLLFNATSLIVLARPSSPALDFKYFPSTIVVAGALVLEPKCGYRRVTSRKCH